MANLGNTQYLSNLGYARDSGVRVPGYATGGTANAEFPGVQVVSRDKPLPVVTIGGKAGAANLYSNAQGDFTAAVATGDTNVVTLSGLSFVLSELHVVGGGRVLRQDPTTYQWEEIDLSKVTVSGDDITFHSVPASGSGWATGDTVYVQLLGPPKAYDLVTDTQEVTRKGKLLGLKEPSLAGLSSQEAGATGKTSLLEISVAGYSVLALRIEMSNALGHLDGGGVLLYIETLEGPDIDQPFSFPQIDANHQIGLQYVLPSTGVTESGGVFTFADTDTPDAFMVYVITKNASERIRISMTDPNWTDGEADNAALDLDYSKSREGA